LEDEDPHKFWNGIKKVSSSKATKFASNVAGAVGYSDIAKLWKNHNNSLFNSVNDIKSKELFCEHV
jgi:hypothetical protein